MRRAQALSVGEVLDGGLGLYRQRPWPYLTLGGMGALPWVLLFGLWSPLLRGLTTNSALLHLGIALLTTLIIGLLWFFLLYPLSSGATTLLAAGDYLGLPVTLGQALRRTLRALPKLWVTNLCKGLTMWAMSIPVFLLFVVLVLPIALLGRNQGAIAWMIALVALAYLVILVCVAAIGALHSLITVVVMVEGNWHFKSVGRSLALAVHRPFRHLWLVVVAYLMRLPIAGLPALAVFAVSTFWGAVGTTTITLVLNILVQAALYPVTALVFTVAYFDLRVRKEAWDVEQTLVDLEAALPSA